MNNNITLKYLVNRSRNHIFIGIVYILFGIISFRFVKDAMLLNFKENMIYYFIINLIIMIYSNNNYPRSLTYLIFSSIAIGGLYLVNYKVIPSIKSEYFIIFSSYIILLMPPFSILHNKQAEKIASLLSVASSYLFLYILLTNIYDKELLLYTAITILVSNALVAIFKSKELTSIAISEIYIVFTILIQIYLNDPSITKNTAISFFIINIAYLIIENCKPVKIVRDIIQVTLGLAPLFFTYHANLTGYIESTYILLLLVLAPKCIKLAAIRKIAVIKLQEKFEKFHFNSSFFNYEIKTLQLPDIKLSFAITLIFTILAIISLF